MKVPDALSQIAADVSAGKTRRAKVRTLMGWYGLKKRREAGISLIREHLQQLGIETDPAFDTADFDGQVRFHPAGTEARDDAAEDLGSNTDDRFHIEEEPAVGSHRRFRVLLRTYDSLERLSSRIIEYRLAQIHFNGQNARREDRDLYPFCTVVALPAGHEPDELAAWADYACSLETSTFGPEQIAPAAEPEPVPGPGDMRDQMDALGASIRACLTEEVASVRQTVERKVDEIRFDAIMQLAKELNDTEAFRVVEEFETEFKAKNAAQEEEIRELNSDLQLAYERIEDLTAAAMEPETGDAYPTMVATVKLFEDLCAGAPIAVSDTALKGAAKSGCTRRREVLLFLLTLRDLSQSLFSRGTRSQPLREWFSARGYEYALSDSKTTADKFGTERTILIDGEKVQMEEHVTLFPNTEQCVSVYWQRDDAQRRLVVGYVGPHFRTVTR